MTDNDTLDRTVPPVILLVAGALAGTATVIVAFTGPNALAVALGALTAVIALWLTFNIAHRQDKESKGLGEIVRQVHELVRDIAERDSAQDYEASPTTPAAQETDTDPEVPSYADEAIVALRAHGADLDFNHLVWRPKKPLPELPGNHGWFVESGGDAPGGRWFVRKARGMTVRKAMPREFLDALEQEAPLEPRAIKLDFQTKEHGLAAWYARTYDGALWKVWRSNRNATKGVQVEKVDDN